MMHRQILMPAMVLGILATLLSLMLMGGCTVNAAEGDTVAAQDLAQGFVHPPDATKPWVYWYWISDNISREGITRDLEAMARVGIGEAFIGNIGLDDIPFGKVPVLSEEWWCWMFLPGANPGLQTPHACLLPSSGARQAAILPRIPSPPCIICCVDISGHRKPPPSSWI